MGEVFLCTFTLPLAAYVIIASANFISRPVVKDMTGHTAQSCKRSFLLQSSNHWGFYLHKYFIFNRLMHTQFYS